MRTRAIVLGGAVVSVSLLAADPAAAQDEDEHTSELGHAEEECIHILEEGGTVDDCHAAPNPILPATNELVFGGLAFLVLLGIMWFFAFPFATRAMGDRTKRIREDLDAAEATKAEASRVLEDYQRQLADAKAESARIIDDARVQAEQMRQDAMSRAESDAAALRQRTQDEIAAAKERALTDVRDQVATLAIGAAEAVVQRNLDADANRALVDQFIQQVSSN